MSIVSAGWGDAAGSGVPTGSAELDGSAGPAESIGWVMGSPCGVARVQASAGALGVQIACIRVRCRRGLVNGGTAEQVVGLRDGEDGDGC